MPIFYPLDVINNPSQFWQPKMFPGSERYLRMRGWRGQNHPWLRTTARARWLRAGGATWLTHFLFFQDSIDTTVSGKLGWDWLPETIAVNILATWDQRMRLWNSVLWKLNKMYRYARPPWEEALYTLYVQVIGLYLLL